MMSFDDIKMGKQYIAFLQKEVNYGREGLELFKKNYNRDRLKIVGAMDIIQKNTFEVCDEFMGTSLKGVVVGVKDAIGNERLNILNKVQDRYKRVYQEFEKGVSSIQNRLREVQKQKLSNKKVANYKSMPLKNAGIFLESIKSFEAYMKDEVEGFGDFIQGQQSIISKSLKIEMAKIYRCIACCGNDKCKSLDMFYKYINIAEKMGLEF